MLAEILQFKSAPQWRDRPDRRVAVIDRFPFRIPVSRLTAEADIQRLTSRTAGGRRHSTAKTRVFRSAGDSFSRCDRLQPYGPGQLLLTAVERDEVAKPKLERRGNMEDVE
jgi:hypothetical protein